MLTLFTLLCLLLFTSSLVAEDDEVISFRKMFVPDGKADSSIVVMPSFPMDRQLFESWIERLEQQSEEQNGKQPCLSKIVLKAALEGRQLVSGQGVFTLHSCSDRSDSIPLHPLTLAVNSLRWTDNTEAVLLCESNGKNWLLVPTATDSHSYDQLLFRWSLQSRKDERHEIVFDFALPPCLNIELQINLPASLVLTASSGLVLPEYGDSSTDSEVRTWRILLGHHSETTLTITADKTLPSVKRKAAIQPTIVYTVDPRGLETVTRITFDKADPRPEELLFALEAPLRPVEVKYGDQPVTWSRLAASSDVTEIRIDLSPFADEEPQILTITAMGPLLENQRWLLPRVRITSPDIVWLATRCAVRVELPLRTQNLICHQGVQVTPRTPPDWTLRETFVYQLFQEDAQIELEVVYPIPQITMNSAVQINWSDSETRATVFLECNVSEGECFTLNFPVSEHWIIDSVTPYSPTGIPSAENDSDFSWDMLSNAQTSAPPTLSVQLNRPLRPRLPVRLQLSCRFINNLQTQFRLAELSPLLLPRRQGELHRVALQLDLTTYRLRFGTEASVFNGLQTLLFDANVLPLSGYIYPLESQTQDIRFDLERMYPNLRADISGKIYVDNNDLIPSYRIRCMPIDSSIFRIFVYFTPSGDGDTLPQWNWTLVGNADPSREPRFRRFSLGALKTLVPASEQQYWSEDVERGEIWEIRFEDFQSVPFELSVNSLIPLTDSVLVPLVSVFFASSQAGEISIESPQHFDYRIVSSRLDSVPVAPPSWDRYQNVRAAFRYDPQEELLRAQHTPLLLEKLTPEERIDSASVWSLRLDSQYEPGGMVRNRALFTIENQGKDSLQITLPRGITLADVSTIWRNSEQVSWQYDEKRNTIGVALPTGQRFVTISLEYAYQDTPLAQQRKLRSRYPSADVPILSGSWIAWFPPEFNVSLRHATSDNTNEPADSMVLSKAVDYLLSNTYRSFLDSIWDDLFYAGQRRSEAETAAQIFFKEIADMVQKNPVATWGELIGNERILSNVRSELAKKDTKRIINTRLLVDKQALTFLGIAPATPIDNIHTVSEDNVRENLFDDAGLVLLITTRFLPGGTKEYVFALTTPMMLSLHRQFQPIAAGHCVRVVPFKFFDSDSEPSPQWIPAPRWLSETTLSSVPWSVSAQVIRWTSLTSDWNAYQLPMNVEQPLYIVHRQKFAALQWIAFLSIVLLTRRGPLSSPIVLFALLIIFELTARSLPPCYIGVPSGALLGVLVSLAFVLIRSRIISEPPPSQQLVRDDSTECSMSFVPTQLSVRSIVLCSLLTLFSVPVAAQTVTEPLQAPPRREPYRVIYPTDTEGNVVGQQVLVPREFIEILHRNIKNDESAMLQQWNITKAVYQGSLIRGKTAPIEFSDDFKVVYGIYLDSPNVTITLPNLPAVPGKFFWDSQPIQPVWQDNVKSGTLSFLIEHETPGEHTLEIALSPKAVLKDDDEIYQSVFAIPQVPLSTLRLNVPPDFPPVHVPDALGAVTANSAIAPVLTAELGPARTLSLTWTDNPNRNGTLVSEVEQFFRIRVKPQLIELNALFRFRIGGGTVRRLTIQTDPRWTRLELIKCLEHTITQRSDTGSSFDDDLVAFPINVSNIEFQSPVSGIVTLEANYVYRDFYDIGNLYGIGNLRLPEFRALNARITRSMLAVHADPLFELVFPVEGRSSGFESGWQGTSVFTPLPFGNIPLWELASMAFTGRDEEIPDAEYDLTRTDPAWMLNIRTKRTVPSVVVSQSTLLDTGESRVRAVGEFTAVSDVFQQHFSASPGIQIETVEVLDSQRLNVSVRLQQISPEQYLIFYRRPVTGKYTVIIRGFLETNIREELVQQPVPMLTFDEVQTTEHSLNFFRTLAVLGNVSSPEPSVWVKSSAIPIAPESFSQPIPIGTWQKTGLPNSNPLDAQAETLQFTLAPNHPKVQCMTTLSLDTDSEERWLATLDFDANITDGDLQTLPFRWDERYGIIQSVEPAASLSFEQSGGQQTLVLSPGGLMRGEQHFKIVLLLNGSGTVTLPNVFPLAGNAERFESALFVDVPRRKDGEVLFWDLHQLQAVGEQSEDAPRLLLQAIDTDFSATLNQDEAKLTAVFYDIGILIKRDGTIIGSATVDLNNWGQDNFVLQMPEGYQPIQITSAGSILERTRMAGSNRWRINIGTSDYPQRISILFRASLPSSILQWKREQVAATIQFPVLEGVAVQETLWTFVFEGNAPSLNVTLVQDRHEYEMGKHEPVSGEEATLSLIGINLIRENNLLQVLRYLPVSSRQEEMQRWFLHWSEDWKVVADKIDFQIARLALTLHSVGQKMILRSSDSSSERMESAGIVRPLLETMGTGTQEALKVIKNRSVLEKFGTDMDTLPKQSVPILNSQVYWQGRISSEMQYLFGAEEGALWAVRLTPMPEERDWTLQFSNHTYLWIGLGLFTPIVVLLSVRWIYLKELWLQFPHFWGMTLGVLLWTFLPASFIGLFIIVWTCLSFLRPSWMRHRSLSKPF